MHKANIHNKLGEHDEAVKWLQQTQKYSEEPEHLFYAGDGFILWMIF